MIIRRTEDEFEVGDVVCYYDDHDKDQKFYSMIICDGNNVMLLDFNGIDAGATNENSISNAMSDLINYLLKSWDHVEKVNTRLVITDEED